MELIGIRTIDELGRIVIPREVRNTNGWETGSKIAIYAIDGDVVLKEGDEEGQEAPLIAQC